MAVIDCGHYIDTPVLVTPDTLEVPAGETIRKVLYIGSGCTLPFNRILLRENSSADICLLVFPGAEGNISISADLAERGASLSLSGIFVSPGEEKLTIETSVLHRAPGCSSDQLINGIAGGKANVKFSGRIIVAPGAEKTEAYQTNHNILLDREARIDTKPQLEIYADDVKCSHGATIGSLNEEEQFYMRSRGIPEQEAKVLQLISFLSPVLSHIGDESEREVAAARIESTVREISK